MVSKSITGVDIYNNLGIKGTKRWRNDPPHECPYCDADNSIIGIEVLGAYDGVLFWECCSCEEKLLRFTRATTIKHLKKTEDLYVNLDGMENIWEELPN